MKLCVIIIRDPQNMLPGGNIIDSYRFSEALAFQGAQIEIY
jgi:hypothetical protein